MSDPYIGEIRPWAFGITPSGWLPCDGRTLTISQYMALYALLGTHFGGNGTSTFCLPNLGGRTPMGMKPTDSRYLTPGMSGGAEMVTLTSANIPAHSHYFVGDATNATGANPSYNYLAKPEATVGGASINLYGQVPASPVTLAGGTVSTSGSGQAYSNMQPYLVMNYCICYLGNYPPHAY